MRSNSLALKNSLRALSISVVLVAASTCSIAARQNLAMRWFSMRWRPATLTRWPTGLPEAAVLHGALVGQGQYLGGRLQQAAGRVFEGWAVVSTVVGAPGGFQVGVGGADVCLRGVGLEFCQLPLKQLDGLGQRLARRVGIGPGGPA